MKWKIGAVLMACVFCLAILPPLLSGAKAGEKGVFAGFGNDASHELVLQEGNARAVVDGQELSLGDDSVAAAAYRSEQGDIMAPVRSVADAMELVMDWDAQSQTVTLTSGKKELSIAVGSNQISTKEQEIAVATPSLNKDGILFVPMRPITQAFAWGYSEEENNALIFISSKSEEIKDSVIKKLSDKSMEILGEPLKKLMKSTIVFRAGSDTVIQNGERTDLVNEEGRFRAPVVQDNKVYLPAKATAIALGGTAEDLGKKGVQITLYDNTLVIATDGSLKLNNKKYHEVTADEILIQDEITYISSDAVRKIFGKTGYDDQDLSLIGTDDFSGATSQMQYLQALGNELPDKRADIPDADAYVALTFDDGPTGGSSGLTARLLDALYERGVKATFFMCGYRIKDFHTHMDRYLAEGHELGNHTMDHPGVLTKKDYPTILDQIVSNSELIKSYTGEGPSVFRPVGGAINDNVKKAAKEAGLPLINWSVDTLDWKYRDANNIKKIILNQAKDGDIVLMHDLRECTVDGVLAAIDELQKKGYAFVTVEELAQIKGVELQAGEVYTNFRDSTVEKIKNGTYKPNY